MLRTLRQLSPVPVSLIFICTLQQVCLGMQIISKIQGGAVGFIPADAFGAYDIEYEYIRAFGSELTTSQSQHEHKI